MKKNCLPMGIKEVFVKKEFFFIVMLIGVLTFCFPQSVISWAVNNTTSWLEVVNRIKSGGNNKEYIITVIGTVSVPPTAPGRYEWSDDKDRDVYIAESTFGSVTGITITIEGNGTLSLSANGYLLSIGDKQTVIARDIVLKGRNANDGSVIEIGEGGIFRMEGNTSVTGNTGDFDSGQSGCGVRVDSNGIFIMQGGTITGNSGVYGEQGVGGVLAMGGTFIMEGGTISANQSNGVAVLGEEGIFIMQGGTISGNYGGVDVNSDATFIMQDGTISGNTGNGVLVHIRGIFTMQGGTISGNNNSGVYVKSTFIMEGGTISGNSTFNGGGVRVLGTFTMRGGTISGNTAIISGGGVYVHSDDYYWGSGTFNMHGGTISGNTATISGGGVYIGGEGKFTKTSGIIYGDDADQNLKNTANYRLGHAVCEANNRGWRNTTAGTATNTYSYSFWQNEGNVLLFPPGFAGTWTSSNINNITEYLSLNITENSITSDYANYWVLQRISGNAYTFKRSDAANTITVTIRLTSGNLEISNDSRSGENNWNGTWSRLSY